jgi:hypothetical protein
VLALAGAIAASPAAAGAATVNFHSRGFHYVDVSDDHSEHNSISVQVKNRLVMVVEHARPRLTAGRGCHARSPHVVACRGRGVGRYLFVEGGRGSDVLRAECGSAGANMSGGPGRDRLVSDGCAATMSGGTADDVLVGDRWPQDMRGGGGNDTLLGGGGNDVLHGDGYYKLTGSDTIDGGSGRDTASWDERRDGVRVDLARGLARAGGELDRLRSIEDVAGTTQADVIAGDAGPNRLWGKFGRDQLVGRGGDDVLDGGSSASFDGFADDNSADRFRCGDGRDLVRFPGPVVLPLGCELMRGDVDLDFETMPTRPPPVGAHTVRVKVVCDPTSPACRRRVTISAGGRVLGRSALKKDPSSIRVKLTAAAPRNGVVSIVVEGDDVDSDVISEGELIPYRFKWRVSCRGAPARDVCRIGGSDA